MDKDYEIRLGIDESEKPRAYTKEEVREMIFHHMRTLAQYWANVDDRPVEERIEGAMFSVLTMIDGSTMSLPLMDLVLRPHPSDKQYHQNEGSNWFEDGMVVNDDCMLHEYWHKKE